MEALRKAFEEAFKIPFSTLVLPGVRLVRVEGAEFLFGSESAAAAPLLVQGAVFSFDQAAPDGYFLTGFWGHGVNSHAFYYARADGWSRVCFRLPFGGIYMDNDACAAHIAEFLPAWFDFERRLGRAYRVTAIESMDQGRYELVHPDGRLVTVKQSMLAKPEFAKRLGVE
jgi:hypothetical protein